MFKEQKVVVGFLLFLGVTALALGLIQAKQGIALGIQKSKGKSSSAQTTQNIPLQTALNFQNETVDSEVLKNKDTDNDGLPDYAELTIYKTSPYLADSDSDGYSDKQEIESSHDPNCPVGQVCRETPELERMVDPFAALKAGPYEAISSGSMAPSLSAGALSGGTPSAQEIRQLLTSQGGISPDLLASLSDEELLEAWKATMGGEVSPLKTNTENTDISGEMPTPSEIRQFLKEQGISEAILQNISNEELLRLFQESLKKVQ